MHILNFPNLLTLLRVSLIPIMVLIYYLPVTYSRELVAFIFLVASATDWLDGYLARKLRQETKFGEFFDPIADKLIVIVALILLLDAYDSYLITLPSIIIVSREIIISGLREWMAQQGESNVVSVVFIGKLKTAIQMLAITILLYKNPFAPDIIQSVGLVALFLAAILTLWSMCIYLYNAWPKLYYTKT